MNLSATVDDVARRHLARNRNRASALHLPQPLTQPITIMRKDIYKDIPESLRSSPNWLL
jgi:hypothetical protein